MAYDKLDKARWEDFFDTVSDAVEGKLVTLEIVGADVGDQIEADQLSLTGMTYDRNDDAMYVEFDNSAETHIVHAVASPREIYVEIGEEGLQEVMIIDGGGRKQFVHLKDTLQLPS